MFRMLLLLPFLALPAFANGVAPGDIVSDPIDLAIDRLSGFPGEEEGRPHVDLSMDTDNLGQVILVVAETGWADDTVNGMRNRYVLSATSDGRWRVEETSREFKCYRGANLDWQTGLCP